jgi:hypothetical protein
MQQCCRKGSQNRAFAFVTNGLRRITTPDQPIDDDDQLPPVCEPVEYELEPADFQSMSSSA